MFVARLAVFLAVSLTPDHHLPADLDEPEVLALDEDDRDPPEPEPEPRLTRSLARLSQLSRVAESSIEVLALDEDEPPEERRDDESEPSDLEPEPESDELPPRRSLRFI